MRLTASIQPAASIPAYACRLSGKIDRVAQPSPGHDGVDGGWNDVVVAAQNGRRFSLEEKAGVGGKAFEPLQLVVEFRAGRGIAIGQIEAPDNKAGDLGLDVAAVAIFGTSGQATPAFDRVLSARQYRDTVV